MENQVIGYKVHVITFCFVDQEPGVLIFINFIKILKIVSKFLVL